MPIDPQSTEAINAAGRALFMLVQDHSILPRPSAIDAEFYIEGGAPTSAQVQVVENQIKLKNHVDKIK